jgi:GNAT superfamily N-acetyltransferase
VSNLEIVPATERDIPVILELIRALADYEKLADRVIATEERLRETLFGAHPAAEVVLAQCDQECAGFAVFFSNYSTFLAQAGLYLEDLYVKPHWRGQGIGLALLKHLAKLAAERGYGRMEWAVLGWNQPAIEFYRKLGAVPLDEWTTYRLSGEALNRLSGC